MTASNERWTREQLTAAWKEHKESNPLPALTEQIHAARIIADNRGESPRAREEAAAKVARLQAEHARLRAERGLEWDVLEMHRRDIERGTRWHRLVERIRDALLEAGSTSDTDVDRVLDDVLGQLVSVADAYVDAREAMRTGDPDALQALQRERYGETLNDLGKVLGDHATRLRDNVWTG
jgi:hypothetical protein